MKTLFVIVCLYLQKRLSQVTDSQKEKPRGRGWDGRGWTEWTGEGGREETAITHPCPSEEGNGGGGEGGGRSGRAKDGRGHWESRPSLQYASAWTENRNAIGRSNPVMVDHDIYTGGTGVSGRVGRESNRNDV